MNFSCSVRAVHRFLFAVPALVGGVRRAQTPAAERVVSQGASRREEAAVRSREPNLQGSVRGRNDTAVQAKRDCAAALPEKNERHEFVNAEGSQRGPGWRSDRAGVGPGGG